MNESTYEVVFESSDWHEDQTAHGLLAAVYEQAKVTGVFDAIRTHIRLTMKTVVYSVHDKFITLLASILVGCDHTSDINRKLGPHEQALASLFGFTRFPDQSTINRTLTACTSATVEEVRALAHHIHRKTTRARQRRLRTKLAPKHGRVLFIDIDQRGICVSGKSYELAEPGYLGRKRGRRGYQLTLAYIGGHVGEVLDEFLDPGNTPAGHRLPDVLDTIVAFARDLKIPLDRIVVRADSQYGTPEKIAQIQAKGLGYLVKGISPQKAAVLARELTAPDFEEAARGADVGARRVCDRGTLQITGKMADGTRPVIDTRTLIVTWQEPVRARGARPGACTRAKRALEPRPMQAVYASLMTSLRPEQVGPRQVLDFYDDRTTIERYFRDEQGALGARSVRTHRHAGAAVFQWFVAIANNLLRAWAGRVFARTPLEGYGIERLIHHVLNVPALLLRTARTVRVILPARHTLTARILAALAPTLPLPQPPASPARSSP